MGNSVGEGVEVWSAGVRCSVYATEQFKEDWWNGLGHVRRAARFFQTYFFDVLLLSFLRLARRWLQVGFHDQKLVCKVHIPKKKSDIVNR